MKENRMKHLKLLFLTVVVAAGVVAAGGVGSASATALCTVPMEPCPAASKITTTSDNVLNVELESGTSTQFRETSSSVFETCTGSSFKAKVKQAGSVAETFVATIAASDFSWSGCVGSGSVVAVAGGELEIHRVLGTQRGTITASGLDIKISSAFTSCTYTVPTKTDIGLLTPSLSSTSEATIEIEALLLKKEGALGCVSDFRWLGVYRVTEPKPLYVVSG